MVTHLARTVLFVCEHGALRSRMAAAWFATVAPPGWHAASAGLEPEAALSPHAARLLSGTPAEELLDRTPPVDVGARPAPTLVVAIDCDVPGAERWDLAAAQPNEAMRDEIATRADRLARALAERRV